MKMYNLFIFFLCISEIVLTVRSISEIVQLPNGKIKGEIFVTEKNTTYYSFRGVPYASSPVGKLRFQPPAEPRNWSDVLNATSDNTICYQTSMGKQRVKDGLEESEDCLYLNIYVPKSTDAKNLPVLLWIFGGGYVEGHASHLLYGPDYFIDQQVIFVSFNYRLGVFGFLSTGDNVLPGNMGLKDQVKALKWVNKNIHLFGGSKNKITIFGESAGGSSVLYHLLSAQSRDLFRAAISNSGTVLNPWNLQRNPKKYALKTAGYIDNSYNHINKTSEEIKNLLLSTSAEDLADAANKVMTEQTVDNMQLLTGFYYTPVLEAPSPDAFISTPMYEALAAGKINKVPILMGFNSEEGLAVAKDEEYFKKVLKAWDNDVKLLVPISMNLKNDTQKAHVGNDIKRLYCGNTSFVQNISCGIRFFSDASMIKCVLKTAQLIQLQSSPVYLYKFSHYGPLGQLNLTIPGTEKVQHFADIFYLFKVANINLQNYPKSDVTTHKRLLKMWTNFIKTLNPTPEKDDLLENVTWPTVGDDPNSVLRYLDIEEHLIVGTNPRNDTYPEWENFFAKYGYRPYSTF